MTRSRSIRYVLLLALSVPGMQLQAAGFDAILEWDDVHQVSIPVDGLVTRVDAEPGQYVSKGESLIRFSQAAPRFALRKAEAAVAAAAPALKEALREQSDAEVLYEQTVLSDVELRAAQIRYQQARAKHEVARADLDKARWALGWTRIKSPYEAVVISSSVLPGQMIAGDVRSEPLMKLASATSMRAVATVAVDNMGSIEVGDSMRVTIGGNGHNGKVMRMQHLVKKNAVDRIRLVVSFETTGRHYPGMKAKLETTR